MTGSRLLVNPRFPSTPPTLGAHFTGNVVCVCGRPIPLVETLKLIHRKHGV